MTETAIHTTDLSEEAVRSYAQAIQQQAIRGREYILAALSVGSEDGLSALAHHGKFFAQLAATAELGRAVELEAEATGSYVTALNTVLHRIRRELLNNPEQRSTDAFQDAVQAARHAARAYFFNRFSSEDL